MNNEQEIFEIIMHAGNARSIAYEALEAAEKNNFEDAERLIKEAYVEIGLAHKTQTKLITDEINGNPSEKSLLMIHSQDHLMTAMSEQKLIEHIIRLHKKLSDK